MRISAAALGTYIVMLGMRRSYWRPLLQYPKGRPFWMGGIVAFAAQPPRKFCPPAVGSVLNKWRSDRFDHETRLGVIVIDLRIDLYFVHSLSPQGNFS